MADITKLMHRSEWAGTFQVRPHYPAGWAAHSEAAKERWKQLARTDEDNKLNASVKREDAPVTPPDDAQPKPPGQRVCWSHHKGLCVTCTNQKQSLVTCCALHHETNQDIPKAWDYCKTHRLTQCGACLLDRATSEACCKRHHPTVKK